MLLYKHNAFSCVARDNDNDILLPEDVQEILHLGRNTVYSYLKHGQIKSLKLGNKYRIPKNNLIAFIYPDSINNNEKTV